MTRPMSFVMHLSLSMAFVEGDKRLRHVFRNLLADFPPERSSILQAQVLGTIMSLRKEGKLLYSKPQRRHLPARGLLEQWCASIPSFRKDSPYYYRIVRKLVLDLDDELVFSAFTDTWKHTLAILAHTVASYEEQSPDTDRLPSSRTGTEEGSEAPSRTTHTKPLPPSRDPEHP